MGMLLNERRKARVHAEARRESFSVYDDFGKGFSLELDWDWLGDLDRAVKALKRYAKKNGKPTERATSSPTTKETER